MPSLTCWLAAAVATAACAGCTMHAQTEPVGYAELYYGNAPFGYAELYYGNAYGYYPHTVYAGRDVYYVGDRWVYRDGTSWGYYQTEPPALYRYRTTIRQAPPAPRYDDSAPRVYQPAQPVPGPAPSPSSPSATPPPARVR